MVCVVEQPSIGVNFGVTTSQVYVVGLLIHWVADRDTDPADGLLGGSIPHRKFSARCGEFQFPDIDIMTAYHIGEMLPYREKKL